MDSKNCNLESLRQMSSRELAFFTQRVAGGLGVSRLMLGRCLVILDEGDRARNLGCSSSLHVAILLGVDKREAREARRIARLVEDLPLLRAAAEKGTISWTSLREILRKATPDTEARWLELATEMSPTRIAKLVSQTREGEVPDPENLSPEEPALTELRAFLQPIDLRIVEQAMRILSEEEGRVLSFTEAILALCAGKIASSLRPSEKQIEKIREAAEFDVAAMEAPWAAVACKESNAPTDPEVLVARPSRVTHWENTRLSFNGQSRGVTPAQRTEILRRDAYFCSTPGCPNHLWLQIHHIVFYCRGGATVPTNLATCCSRCHRNIHEGHLLVTGDAPRGLRWTTTAGLLETSFALAEAQIEVDVREDADIGWWEDWTDFAA